MAESGGKVLLSQQVMSSGQELHAPHAAGKDTQPWVQVEGHEKNEQEIEEWNRTRKNRHRVDDGTANQQSDGGETDFHQNVEELKTSRKQTVRRKEPVEPRANEDLIDEVPKNQRAERQRCGHEQSPDLRRRDLRHQAHRQY